MSFPNQPGRGIPLDAEAGSTLTVLAGSAVALTGTVAVRAVMARTLDLAGFGTLITAIAIVTVAGGIANLGINPATALRVADCLKNATPARAGASARSALTIGIAAGLAAGLLVFVGAAVLGSWFTVRPALRPALAASLRVLMPVTVLMPIGGAALGIYRGHGKTLARALIRDGGGGLARALGVTLGRLAGGSLSLLGIGYSAGVVAAEGGFVLALLGRGWLRRDPGEPRSDPELLRRLPPFAGIEMLAQGRLWLDLLALGLLAPPAMVGLYGLARSLSRGLEVVYQAGVHRYLPAVGSERHAARPALAERSRRLMLALLLVPLAIGIMAPEIPVLLLAGAPYRPAAPLLQLLSVAVLIDALFGYQDQTLLALGRSATAAGIDLGALALFASLLALLIPPLGASGAALALIGATAGRAVAFAIALRSNRLAGWPLVSGALPAVFCLAAGSILIRATTAPPAWAGSLALLSGLAGILLLRRAGSKAPAAKATA